MRRCGRYLLWRDPKQARARAILERFGGEHPAPRRSSEAQRRAAAALGPDSCPKGTAFIPGGKFFMGTTNEKLKISQPEHKVTLSPYCMDVFEVTERDYKACSDSGDCKRAKTAPEFPKPEKQSDEDFTRRSVAAYAEFCNFDKPGREDHPINCVSWSLADNYCKVHYKGRLPTEAEWEFAARGSDGRKFPWGDEIGTDKEHMNAAGLEFSAWQKSKGLDESHRMFDQDDGYAGTAPVGSFKKGVTKFGLYDMVGNVWEWTNDRFATYPTGEATDPTGAPVGETRAIRGGGFNGGYESWLDPAFRYFMDANAASHGIGFRCAKPLSLSDPSSRMSDGGSIDSAVPTSNGESFRSTTTALMRRNKLWLGLGATPWAARRRPDRRRPPRRTTTSLLAGLGHCVPFGALGADARVQVQCESDRRSGSRAR